MKHLLACAAVLLVAFPALAQDAGAERERIRSERTAAEVRFAAAQRECRARFAVNDCLEEVQREHAAAVADLRRQERVLNDTERRRRSAERQQALDERSSPASRQQAEERRQRALQDRQDREQRAAEKAAGRAADEAARARQGPRVPAAPRGAPQPPGSARAPQAGKPSGPGPQEAAQNRRDYEQRVKQAQQHKAEVQQRIARRSKPAASALPPPVR